MSTRRPGMELVISAHKSVAELGVIGRADDMHAIMDAERDATLAYLDDLTQVWLFLATTGCRRGEALGLRWKDVDLDGAKVLLRQSVNAINHKLTIKPYPKSGKAGPSSSTRPRWAPSGPSGPARPRNGYSSVPGSSITTWSSPGRTAGPPIPSTSPWPSTAV